MEIYRDAFDECIAALLSLPGKVDMMHDDSVSLTESRKVFRERGRIVCKPVARNALRIMHAGAAEFRAVLP